MGAIFLPVEGQAGGAAGISREERGCLQTDLGLRNLLSFRSSPNGMRWAVVCQGLKGLFNDSR